MRSIKTKLLFMVVGILVLSNGVVSMIAFKRASKALQGSVENGLRITAQNVADKVNETNAKQIRMLEALAAIPTFSDENVPLLDKVLLARAVKDIHPEYENVIFYDLQGRSYTAEGQFIQIPDRDYLKAAFSGKTYITRPTISKVTGALILQYAVPIFNSQKKVVGAFCANVHGKWFSEFMNEIPFGKSGHPEIIDMATGYYVASTDINNVIEGKNIDQFNGTDLARVYDDVRAGKTGGNAYTDPVTKKLMTCAYQPVGGGCTWAVFGAANYMDFFGELTVMGRILLAATVVAVILASVLLFVALTIFLNPLKLVKDSITTIASGNADLTNRIKQTSKDEIGDVVLGFNKFTEKLQSIISEVKESKEVLGMAGQNLQDSTQDTAASITEILANIDSVHSQITNQGRSVHETAGAVNEIASNISSLEKMIENQSAGVTQASAAVEEMIGNIASVNQSVDKMAESFEELQAHAQNGSAKQDDVNEKIEQIESQSELLQEANAAISAIAEQTNLLAMNAAIEAAHAGEAGKGFSVVADEIRKLSETSTVQSKTIGDQLNKIKESIVSVVSASAESREAFHTVADKIRETDQLVRQIKSAMEEQNEGSQQITEALHSMNDSTSEVKVAAAEMEEGNKTILEEIRNLENATTVMNQSMEEMSIGARKINETGAALTSIAGKMDDSISDIGAQIDQFKV